MPQSGQNDTLMRRVRYLFTKLTSGYNYGGNGSRRNSSWRNTIDGAVGCML